jgi:hypothetical protein
MSRALIAPQFGIAAGSIEEPPSWPRTEPAGPVVVVRKRRLVTPPETAATDGAAPAAESDDATRAPRVFRVETSPAAAPAPLPPPVPEPAPPPRRRRRNAATAPVLVRHEVYEVAPEPAPPAVVKAEQPVAAEPAPGYAAVQAGLERLDALLAESRRGRELSEALTGFGPPA